MTAPGNAMVWDRAQRGHYEVWYLTASHLASGAGFWVRLTLEAPYESTGEPYCEAWFACFDPNASTPAWGFHQRFPIGLLEAQRSPHRVRIGDHAEVTDKSFTAKLSAGGHEVSWDLSWLPAPEVHLHYPPALYNVSRIDTKVCSPNLNVPLRGTIRARGPATGGAQREWSFEGDPADQTHVWGRKHAHAWVWSHCNAFAGNRSAAWEGISARLKRGGIVLPTLTVVSLDLDGEKHHFTGLGDTLLSRGSWKDGHYQARASGRSVKLEAEFTSRPEHMIATPYVDPDGEPSYCMNSCIADCTVTVWRRSPFVGRWREAARLTARGGGHWEYGQRAPDPAVKARHEAYP